MDSDGKHHHHPVERNQIQATGSDERNEHADVEGGGGGGGGGDPMAHIMLDIDGEELIFSDDTFPSLPDFPCLSSPSSARNPSLSSSSSSSSSSSWSFIKASTLGGGDDDMQNQTAEPSTEVAMVVPTNPATGESEGLDILGDIDLLDLASDPLDPSFLFPDDSIMINDGVTPPPAAEEDGGFAGGAAEGTSEDLSKIFLDWLKSNKDSISAEDLRSIKLKRSTIECAARRLGGGKQGKTQLLKLILAWVQNHHLQKRRRRYRNQHQDHHNGISSFPYRYQPFTPLQHHLPVLSDPPFNPNPNPNPNLNYSFDADSWISHPTTAVAFPPMMLAEAPYHYPTSSIVVNSQPFSPSPEFHAVDAGAGWGPPQFPATPSPFSPFPGPSSPHPLPISTTQYPVGFSSQYSGQPLYNPAHGQCLTGLASATKEARKKRMARQRRFSSLHHHRTQNQPQQQQQQNSRPIATAEMNTSSRANSRSWVFWPSSSSACHQTSSAADGPPPPPPPQDQSTMQPPSLPPTSSFQRHTSSSEKRQGWKGEKNLRFLLQKVLKQSDVGSLGRIVLPKKEAEIHLPELDARDGISIAMEDIGTSRVWNMRYRFWPNNKSRMYLLENTGDFVRSNGLQEGDFIVIYSDIKCGKYMIRGVKVRQPPESKAVGGRNAVKLALPQKRSAWDKVGASKGKTTSNCESYGDEKLALPQKISAWEKMPPPRRPPPLTGENGGDTLPSTTHMEASP